MSNIFDLRLKNEEISREAEQLVIASLIYESNAIFRVNELLTGDMFESPVNRLIYNCIENLSNNTQHIDMLSVSNLLRNENVFINAGGIVYLSRLSGLIATTIHLEDWADIIFDTYINRRIMLMSVKFYESARMCHSSGAELLIEIRNHIEMIEKKIPMFGSLLNAESVMDISMKSMEGRMETYKNGIEFTGITSGLKDLDEITGGWQNSDLIVLAARPSIGKTSVAMHLLSAAAESGKHAVIFSMEMKAEKLGDKLILGHSYVDPKNWRSGNISTNDLVFIKEAGQKLSALPFYVDDSSQMTIGKMKSVARRMKLKNMCDIVFIDYLQLAEMKSDNRNVTKNDLVTIASNEAKRLAKDLNIPVVLLSQLNRGVEGRPNKTPELADLRDSGAIEQDADMVILIHRPEFYGIMEDKKGNSTVSRGELIISKNRNGQTGTVFFRHNKSLTKIEDYRQ